MTQYTSQVQVPTFHDTLSSPVDVYGVGFRYYKRWLRLTASNRASVARGVPVSRRHWPTPSAILDPETRIVYNMAGLVHTGYDK